ERDDLLATSAADHLGAHGRALDHWAPDRRGIAVGDEQDALERDRLARLAVDELDLELGADLDAVLLLAGLDDCVHGSSWARPSSDGHVVDMVRRPSIRTRNAECTARLARASNGTAPIGVPMKGVPRSWPTACNRDRPTLEAGGNSRRAGLQRTRSVASITSQCGLRVRSDAPDPSWIPGR